jgi:hypothetical protein
MASTLASRLAWSLAWTGDLPFAPRFESFMKTRCQNAGEHITTSSPAGVPKFMMMFNSDRARRSALNQRMAR